MGADHDLASLAERVAALVGDVEAVLTESESRLIYRRDHGRQLSQAHVDALADLLAALDSLRERLGAVVGPDIEALRREFDELQQRLRLEEHDGNE